MDRAGRKGPAATSGRPAPSASGDEQRLTPVLDGLLLYRERDYAPFHMPGHKRGAGSPPRLREALGAALDVDLPLTPGFEDTRQRTGYLGAAEALAAAAWGADRAYFLTNGSSGGLHTLVLALAPPGSVVIAPRNAHLALTDGLIFSGATPVYVEPEVDPEWGVALNVPAERFAAALADHPEASAVFVTSPSYNGCCADLDAIVGAAHAAGTAVAVDQAWGAHLRFCGALPADAVSQGADALVASIHKLTGGVTQASLIAARSERIDLQRLTTFVAMLRSTSLLVPILASIDATRHQMVADGEALWSRAIELADAARERLRAVPGLRCMDAGILERASVADLDRTRLTVSAADLGWAGYELEWELRERYRIAVETADSIGIVMNVTYADTPEFLERLVSALTEIAARGPLTGAAHKARAALRLDPPPFARLVMTPRAAFFGRTRALPLRECVGQVGAEVVTPYPPGVPVLGPGEEITGELVQFLAEVRRRGLAVHGPHDPTMATLRVVDRPLEET
jgi:arginine/lysine/ornithine decarboxylase